MNVNEYNLLSYTVIIVITDRQAKSTVVDDDEMMTI